MHHQSPIKPPRFGRTAAIAAAVIAAVAVLQLGSVTVAFFKKSRQAKQDDGEEEMHSPPMKIDVTKLIAEAPPPEDPVPLNVDPLASGNSEQPPGPHPNLPHAEPVVPLKENGGSETASVPPPRPTPVPLSAFTPKTDPRFGELIEEGKLLRGSGDTAGALAKFREASALQPGNASAIAEQAYTFEKMSLPDKAADQWKRVLAMGDRAGAYYSAAKSKLETAVKETMHTTSGGGPEIPQGKVLAIGSTVIAEEQDPSAAKKFALSLPIRVRMAEQVAVRDVKVLVLFYEKANGKDIAKTIANVSHHWTTPPVDWKDGDTETLDVDYELSAVQARTEHREYYGYIVRLYYRGELQDTKAEPASLSQKFPAPYALSE
ncbi:MAG: hypothetical protein ABI318_23840 [Chthoniobacteraceae bacterium]